MDQIIKDFDDFKKADQTTRDYFIYSGLLKLHNIDKTYAKKWVEKVLIWAGVTMGGAVLYSIINLVLIDSN